MAEPTMAAAPPRVPRALALCAALLLFSAHVVADARAVRPHGRRRHNHAQLQPGAQAQQPKAPVAAEPAAPAPAPVAPTGEGLAKLKKAAASIAAMKSAADTMRQGADSTLETRLAPLRVVMPPGVANPVAEEECYGFFARVSMCPGGSELVSKKLACAEQESSGDAQFSALYSLVRHGASSAAAAAGTRTSPPSPPTAWTSSSATRCGTCCSSRATT
jgi:hypothetical protein